MKPVNNLIGLKFGRLTALKDIGSKRNNRLWLCSCECGNIKSVISSSLKTGVTKSCGCLQKEKAKLTGTLFRSKGKGVSAFNTLFYSYRSEARKRNLEFKLSETEFKELISNKCFYCNSLPANVFFKNNKNGELRYNGIDRVDNTKGYLIKNVVPCCKHCNMSKKDRTLKEFVQWAAKISATFLSR